ncbi:hypothetical protein DCO16_05535 [Polynucleobacter antarcticus]|uniref:Uncharacterized protein n=2 Tax=Polynucleobacter antarcticus TaxID=1743162 RepID=A0A6M9PUX6_9BURK|nr:hypothetical protein DCO16_05535 [Polynucleobacter antarcticus]
MGDVEYLMTTKSLFTNSYKFKMIKSALLTLFLVMYNPLTYAVSQEQGEVVKKLFACSSVKVTPDKGQMDTGNIQAKGCFRSNIYVYATTTGSRFNVMVGLADLGSKEVKTVTEFAKGVGYVNLDNQSEVSSGKLKGIPLGAYALTKAGDGVDMFIPFSEVDKPTQYWNTH